eukprot:TRINITY_DN2156_c0_g1_i2.p1 TRINITY_DN2156_c0_g1~~TRINITY_DN2156_c0_g1_i2.p1  ORF type:complete len:383 (-),score=107.29 TRINITY_DN2156_c0_g1_i2:220-1368(-)
MKDTNIEVNEAAKGFNRMGFEFATKFKGSKEKPNFLLSSYSIGEVLSLLCNGASQSNEEEMKRALHLEGLDTSTINQSVESAREVLTGGNSVIVSVANGIWVDPAYQVADSFKEVAKVYKSATSPLTSASEINNWISNHTHGRIKNVIGKIESLTKMILVNAVYFKGQFTVPFDVEYTTKETFHGAYGKTQVDMMKKTDKRRYLETDLFQAVKLPYKSPKGSVFESVIILPVEKKGMAKVLEHLKVEELKDFKLEELELRVPKLKLESEVKLNDQLKAMGMKEAFSSDSSFPKLSDPADLHVDEVLHKCVLEMDEKGTVAAAVTAVMMKKRKRSEKIAEMVVNRPFILLLREENSGIILFTAVVNHCEGVNEDKEEKEEETR